MLVLGRKINQQIIINEELIIMVTDVSYNFVKLGFIGPKDKFLIDRYEIYEKKLFGELL